MNEPEKKRSVKKTMGVIGCIVVFGIAVAGAIAEPSETANILYPLMLFVGALFGIHTTGKVLHEMNLNGNK